MRAVTFALTLMALGLGTSSAFAAPLTPVLVDTCGQVVPQRVAAYLAADLDCSAYGGSIAVDVRKRSSFDLGGFTLTTGATFGISCPEGKCTIRNGTVTGDGLIGIAGIKTVLENLTVSMSGMIAAALDHGSIVRGSTIAGTATVGLYSSQGKQKTRIIDSTITGHRALGVSVIKADLLNSTVTGNMNGSECTTTGDSSCADLRSIKRPKLRDSTCGFSAPQQRPDCYGWCVCTEDLF
jgi:hypothetical protein